MDLVLNQDPSAGDSNSRYLSCGDLSVNSKVLTVPRRVGSSLPSLGASGVESACSCDRALGDDRGLCAMRYVQLLFPGTRG